jgi:uncharacterized protein YyaL (SSP411 family)
LILIKAVDTAHLNSDAGQLGIFTTIPPSDNPKALRRLPPLDNMAFGGIYDQLGGGFSRYSTDEDWLVPHFEKMLYDNAQLVSLYVHAYQKTVI